MCRLGLTQFDSRIFIFALHLGGCLSLTDDMLLLSIGQKSSCNSSSSQQYHRRIASNKAHPI